VTKPEAVQLGRIVVAAVRDYVARRFDVFAQEMRSAWAAVKDETAAVRERMAVIETRASVPGPSGPPGRDGTDGLGFDDLIVDHDGERAFTFKCVRGDVVKVLGTFTIPVPIYRKLWTEGRTYEPGDLVTWSKSIWHCEKSTSLKPDGVYRNGPQAKDFWTLAASRGRDGNDGKDGAPGPPGPRGPGWEETFHEKQRR
jgi:hypothetical protein